MEPFQVIQLVIAFVAGINLPVIIMIYRRLRQIKNSIDSQKEIITFQNGRIVRLEEWRVGYEKWGGELKAQVDNIDERCRVVLTGVRHETKR